MKLIKGFTLIELLIVISIMGLLAGLTIPAIKSISKSQTLIGGVEQFKVDVQYARQLAISRHASVYMIFSPVDANAYITNPNNLTTNVYQLHFNGYSYVTLHSAGDQPGIRHMLYLSSWLNLPYGVFIMPSKFITDYTIINNKNLSGQYIITKFNMATNIFNFPSDKSPAKCILPYIAFNSRGQLTDDGINMAANDEYIPLESGTIVYPSVLSLAVVPFPLETPPGNSTNIYNIIHINNVTGFVTIESPHLN